MRLARRLWTRRPPAARPLRDKLLSIGRLEERTKALAASLTVDPDRRRRGRNIFPRFDDNARLLRQAYRTLADDVRRGEFITSAAEWLLDNFHLVTSEIRGIRQNPSRTYYRRLPTLALRAQAGHARIDAIAIELIRHSDSQLSRHQLTQFLDSYQRIAARSSSACSSRAVVVSGFRACDISAAGSRLQASGSACSRDFPEA